MQGRRQLVRTVNRRGPGVIFRQTRFCDTAIEGLKNKKIDESDKYMADLDRRRCLLKQNTEGKESGFQDITEFLSNSSNDLSSVKESIENGKEPQTSTLEYFTMFGGWCGKKVTNTREWISMTSEERKKRKEDRNAERTKNRASSDETMAQFYQSQELINLMKFKEVTFDNGREKEPKPAADFEAFSRRICDNYDLFKKTEAYSNMSFHVVKDPSKRDTKFEKEAVGNYRQVEEGTLTSWMTDEQPEEVTPAEESKTETEPTNESTTARPAPFVVDYITGEVTILDTCSPDEFLDFLEREAPRAEIRQIALHEEQMKMYQAIHEVTEKLSLEIINFNSGKSSQTDPEFKKLKAAGKADEYVLPADIIKAMDKIKESPRLYKNFLKGHNLRLMPTIPARAYYVDGVNTVFLFSMWQLSQLWGKKKKKKKKTGEAKEVCIPKDFAKDTFLQIHTKYRRIQKVCFLQWNRSDENYDFCR